jgi:hypothetical protein
MSWSYPNRSIETIQVYPLGGKALSGLDLGDAPGLIDGSSVAVSEGHQATAVTNPHNARHGHMHRTPLDHHARPNVLA